MTSCCTGTVSAYYRGHHCPTTLAAYRAYRRDWYARRRAETDQERWARYLQTAGPLEFIDLNLIPDVTVPYPAWDLR